MTTNELCGDNIRILAVTRWLRAILQLGGAKRVKRTL